MPPETLETTYTTLEGHKGKISIKQIPISLLDYLEYQVSSTKRGTFKGKSLGQFEATNVLIQKSFQTEDIDLLKELGYNPPTNDQGEDVKKVGISPGVLELLGVELSEHQRILRRVVGVKGVITYNDLSDEDVEKGKGLNQSNDFSYEKNGIVTRVTRDPIPWTMTTKIQSLMASDPKKAYVDLFKKFKLDGENITYEQMKDPSGMNIEIGILVFLKLSAYLNDQS